MPPSAGRTFRRLRWRVSHLQQPAFEELEGAWKSLRSRPGISVREVACVGAARTLLVAEVNVSGERRPLVSLSAGVHGDEPAGPWALFSIVRDGLLDERFAYRIWPCTNPTGYRAASRKNADGADINRSFRRGGQTPEARAIITANRDRRFALSIDLHEDFEATGFYLYEAEVDAEARLGAAVIAALDDAALPVQDIHGEFDLAYPPQAAYAWRGERGRIITNIPELIKHFDGLSLSMFMQRRAAHRTLTFESPRCEQWNDRIATHRVAVVSALAAAAFYAPRAL